jgi:glycosyltransferase involved in cell wall biosynthesis
MLHTNSLNSKVLLTTPDYPPKLGGLSTFCKNIEFALKSLGLDYDLLVWDPKKPLSARDELAHSYQWGVHIHFQGGLVLADKCEKNINFLHGSEILFTSPNPLKRLMKSLLKGRALNYLQKSYFNISISEFTMNRVSQKGLNIDYARDLVFHNCIDLNSSHFVEKSLSDDVINFICVARDVPHKNLELAFELVMSYSMRFQKKVKFYCTREFDDFGTVECFNIQGRDDEEIRKLYCESHFNLLLSRDDSKVGFYEGFGLTVLESGCWGTPSITADSGGLPEACHDLETGWVYNLGSSFDNLFDKIEASSYPSISRRVFEHSHQSHGRILYEKLLLRVLS